MDHTLRGTGQRHCECGFSPSFLQWLRSPRELVMLASLGPGTDILEVWGDNMPGTIAGGRAIANSIPRSKKTILHIIDPMV